MDPLAVVGAVTGTTGVLIAARREYLSGRRRLAVAPGVNFTTSRVEPVGLIRLGWACIAFWNTGGRPLAIERAGFQYLAIDKQSGQLRVMRAMLQIKSPIEAAVDGPTHKLYTPLGPMLASGISPVDVVEALCITTGGREWLSPPQPLIASIPPVGSAERFNEGLEQLRSSSEAPPVVGNEISLAIEEPYLVDTPPD